MILFSYCRTRRRCHTLHKKYKWLAIFTAVWMGFVLLGGALVTKTDSGQGCGDSWTIWLCNGKFSFVNTVESLIEYSHRAVSGIVGILVLVLFIIVLVKFRKRKDLVLYASTTLFFTVLQAFLGALAVVHEQSSATMALHFGFSLLAFTTTLLLAISFARLDRPAHPSGWGEEAIINGPKVSKGFGVLVWISTIYTYIVVYTGAFMRHTESWAGCQGWPLCNGKVIPSLTGAEGIAFFHRIAALLLLIIILWMVIAAYRRYGHIREIRKASMYSFILTVLQMISGAFVVFTLTSANLLLLSSLVHTILIAGLFGILCYLSILVWQMRK